MRIRSAIPGTAAAGVALILVISPLAGQVRAAEPYTVQPGDTLSAIASRASTSVSELVALNHLANPNHIVPGERLVLPDRPQSASRSVTRTVIHVVRPGEQLTGIAAHFGTTIAGIAAANHLTDVNMIFAGQRLRIVGATRGFPASAAKRSTAAARPQPTTRIYRVRTGDTLTAIANRFRTTIGRLVTLNGLANPSYIRIGQLLRVPVIPPPAKDAWSIAGFEPDTQALMSQRLPIARLVAAEAKRAGVPVALALAVAWQESGWRQSVVSSAGAIGVMQLLPDTAEWIADAMLDAPIDVGLTRDNVHAGVTLLRHYMDRYRGDRRLVLAAYYQGQRALDEHGVFPVSRPYIASILLLEALFRP